MRASNLPASPTRPAGRVARRVTAAILAAGVLTASVSARAGEAGPLVALPAGVAVPAMLYRPVNTAPAPETELSPEVQQSLGCAITGTVGTGAAIIAGGENLVNIIAGGVVAPANKAVLYIGLVGVVFASFCAIGQALTPLYLYATAPAETPSPDAAPRPAAVPHRVAQPALRIAVSAHGPLAGQLAGPSR
jgi:hypothetical protein